MLLASFMSGGVAFSLSQEQMAALSLTEIRDAFVDEQIGELQFNTPVQELPEHGKKSNPVNVRLVADATPNQRVSSTHRSKHKSRSGTTPSRSGPSEEHTQLARIANNALTLTIGLAVHSAVISTLNNHFEASGMSTFNQLCMRFTYPIATLLLVWALKRWS